MTNTFQISRCWYLIRKELFENKTSMIKCYCVFFVLLLLLKLNNFNDYIEWINSARWQNLLQSYKDIDVLGPLKYLWVSETKYFNVLLFIFITYITVKAFPLSNRQKRITYLSIPTSALEKYISAFTINLTYIASFFAVGLLSELLRIGICALFYPESEIMFLDPYSSLSFVNANEISGLYITVCYFTLFISFVLVCTTCKRSVLVSATGYFLLSVFIFIVVFGLISTDISFSTFISEFRRTSLKFTQKAVLDGLPIVYVWIIVNIVLSYFRLKKLQIV